ncbi:hypothetical protein EVAR_86805_1 [Eumeta japonica]|uniref:Uncharacterized protein n=1 Tax=Eumeta variegata TaxID=151549 RepID=A0A4C1VVG7_EUMVA|nr:hypothetical protein EVAR_86805_1 [Eumeta japonica]
MFCEWMDRQMAPPSLDSHSHLYFAMFPFAFFLEFAIAPRTRAHVDPRVAEKTNQIVETIDYSEAMEASNRGEPLPPRPCHQPGFPPLCPTPSQKTGNALLTPPWLRVSMGGCDHLLSAGSPIRLSPDYAIKRNTFHHRHEKEAFEYCKKVANLKTDEEVYIFIRKCRGSKGIVYLKEFLKSFEGSTDVLKAFDKLGLLLGHKDSEAVFEVLSTLSGSKSLEGLKQYIFDITGGLLEDFLAVFKILLEQNDLQGFFKLFVSVMRKNEHKNTKYKYTEYKHETREKATTYTYKRHTHKRVDSADGEARDGISESQAVCRHGNDLREAILEFNKLVGHKKVSENFNTFRKFTGQKQLIYGFEEVTHEADKLNVESIMKECKNAFGHENIVSMLEFINKITKKKDALTSLEYFIEVTGCKTLAEATAVWKRISIKFGKNISPLFEYLHEKCGHDDIISFIKKILHYTGKKKRSQANGTRCARAAKNAQRATNAGTKTERRCRGASSLRGGAARWPDVTRAWTGALFPEAVDQ